jgi:hypothetical protein
MMSKVILSQNTLSVLKNFASINTSIVINSGNVLKTISNAENILAIATVEETFPKIFAVYDLNQFLDGISLFDNPILIFDNDDYVTIQGSRSHIKYYFSDPEITLKTAPNKKVNYPGSDIQFNLTAADIFAILKAKSIYGIPDLNISTDEKIVLSVRDNEVSTSNTYDMIVLGTFEGKHSLNLKVDNIRLIKGDYRVGVSKHQITEWKHTDIDLTYYIALEP